MKVLMVAAEAVPFAKTGGLADVVGVLPKFLSKLGADVRVVMPRYASIDKEAMGLTAVGGPLGVPMGVIGTLWCSVFEGRLPKSEVPIYFIEFDQFFNRPGMYNGPDGDGYADNDNRFLFLSRAALELARMLRFVPDVVHCNDWHTAAVPIYLNTLYRGDPALGSGASLLSIHNLEHQGVYYKGLMEVLGVGWERFNHLELEWHDQVNLLKGGIYHATRLSTVSPTYAKEIMTPAFGHQLDGVLRDRAALLRGILNGIDYDTWNPETDPHLPAHYSVDDLAGKERCKRALQREMGLPERDVPLFGVVSRLVHQKGTDILARALLPALNMDVQFAILGDGDPLLYEALAQVQAARPDRLALRKAYDNPLAHRIEAGADFFVMPSRFEPCGLNQLYSLRYGTLPIVHAIGGLDDTVENYDEQRRAGTGFKFYDIGPKALLNTLRWATYTWYNRREVMGTLIRRAMRRRFSWDDSARRYLELYREAVRQQGGELAA